MSDRKVRKPLTWSWTRVAWVSAAAIALLLALAVAVGTIDPPEKGALSFELRTSLIQFFLVTAVGAVVAVLVDFTKSRARSIETQLEFRTKVLTEILSGLDTAYGETKLVRRLLRVAPPARISEEEYAEQMLRLSTVRFAVERLRGQVDALAQRRIPGLEDVSAPLKEMDTYLSELWTEREEVAQRTEPGSGSRPRFDAFTAFRNDHHPHSDFDGFYGSYHKAQKRIVNLLGDILSGEEIRGGL